MKRSFLLLIIASFSALTSIAQELVSRNWASVSQNIDASEFRGKKFKLSGAIKKESFNGNELASVWARVDTEDGETGFFSNPYDEIEVTEKWNGFTVEGVVDNTADELVIGVFCMNNGTFFFDDLRLDIQDKAGTWIPVKLKNPDFEESTVDESLIWGKPAQEVKQFSVSITDEDPYKGKYSLRIEGKGVYGQNDERGGYVEVNGVKLYYEIYGKGDPLLLLHGNGQSIEAFQNQIGFFAEKYKVIAVDSRGRGRSSDNEEELTYELQARDMKLFLDTLNIDAANIIGWSDGGIIGIQMAVNYPEKVKKLVAMAANIFPEGLFPERLKQHRENLKKLEEENSEKNRMYIKLYKLLVNYPKLTFEDLHGITAPTLIIAGDHDVIQEMHTVQMFRNIPKANLAILPGETHWLPYANPKLFNEITMNFLTRKFKEPSRF